MTTKKTDLSDINALAMEACDLWQEHLSNFANSPSARAELTRFLEPQRRLFADWAAMMRQGAPYDPTAGREKQEPGNDVPSEAPSAAPSAEPPPAAAAAPPSSAPSGGAPAVDDPLRVAQLAVRLAELEKRVGRLEVRDSGSTRGSERGPF